jgi:hypothetical protein
MYVFCDLLANVVYVPIVSAEQVITSKTCFDMMQPQLMSLQQDHGNTFSFHKRGAPTPSNLKRVDFSLQKHITRNIVTEVTTWQILRANTTFINDLKIAELVT